MPRKFSIDIPRLKIGRNDRTIQQHLALSVESPPPSPKSIRPALPSNLESELRLACAQILDASATEESVSESRRLRREQRTLQNSALQHSNARSALPSAHHDRPQPQLPKIETAQDTRPRHTAASAHPDVYAATHNTAPWSPDTVGRDRNIQKTATRVEQVMAGSQQAVSVSASFSGTTTKTWPKSDVHSRSKSVSQAMITSKSRPIYAPRADSVDTTLSASHSDMTDGVSTSTGMTSAVHTPVRASKRTSSSNNLHDAALAYETMHVDGMRERLEMHRKMQEQHETEVIEQLYEGATVVSPLETKPALVRASISQERYYAKPDRFTEVPAQSNRDERPGTSSRHEDRPSTGRSMRSDARAPSRLLARSRAGTHEDDLEDQRVGRSTFRERATRAARSLSRGVKKHMRSASRQAESEWQASDKDSRSRPQTPVGRRKMSLDFMRRGRQASRDSLIMPNDVDLAKHDVPVPAMPTKWDPYPRHGTGSSGGDARPGSVDSNMPATAQRSQAGSPAIDLNRKLPPLPSLQSWSTESGQQPNLNPAATQTNNSSHNSSDDRTPTQEHINQQNNQDEYTLEAEPRASTSDLGANPPPLEMSATFFPGDLDFYAPMRTPSPCSESSLKDFVQVQRQKSINKPSVLSLETSMQDEEDKTSIMSSPTSPKVARLISRISVPNMKPQIIDAARRPSGSPKPPAPPRKDSKRSLEMLRPKTASPQERFHQISQPQPQQDPATTNLMHYQLLSRNNAGYNTNAHGQPVDNMQTMIEASSSKPTILLRKKTKKQWWFAGPKKKGLDWMSDVENSGSRSGMLVMHDTAAAPVIRY